MSLTVAIVGVTGAVGQEFIKVLEARNFPATNYKLLASARSVGKTYTVQGKTYTTEELTTDSFEGVNIALFSAGGGISKQFASAAVKAGAVVVDNSSAFRMDPDVPLVVPEVNPQATNNHNGIIANPNCSTIIANVALWPLHKENKIKRLVVSTYQAVSGAGATALVELKEQVKQVLAGEKVTPQIFKHQCAFNVFSHDSDILENGYNEEEMKMHNETRKIFNDEEIVCTCTCIRVPVYRAHSESINIEFTNPTSAEKVRALLSSAPGVTVVDDRENNKFPMTLEATDQGDILVGRIRMDETIDNNRGVNIFISGDQILKGAALNAVQIAELLV